MGSEQDRGARAWTNRCEYGSLSNRAMCRCGHCQVWRQEQARRWAAREAVVQADKVRRRRPVRQ